MTKRYYQVIFSLISRNFVVGGSSRNDTGKNPNQGASNDPSKTPIVASQGNHQGSNTGKNPNQGADLLSYNKDVSLPSVGYGSDSDNQVSSTAS
ncbi:MAG: hypothetical protein ACWIPH_05580, partial [Ostreibacterium sp.]